MLSLALTPQHTADLLCPYYGRLAELYAGIYCDGVVGGPGADEEAWMNLAEKYVYGVQRFGTIYQDAILCEDMLPVQYWILKARGRPDLPAVYRANTTRVSTVALGGASSTRTTTIRLELYGRINIVMYWGKTLHSKLLPGALYHMWLWSPPPRLRVAIGRL